MEIYNFRDCPFSKRHGRYGGQAGDKDGVLINGEFWMIKFPKNTAGMQGNVASYTTSPLSEYVGSHVYEILDIPVHETLLGVRNNKLVVACKDFQENLGDLAEIRMLKNAANKQIEENVINLELNTSATGDFVNLNELLIHFKYNPLLHRSDVIARFWKMVIVDALINNNDRNNGNWGLLFNNKTDQYDLAPVYDCGNAFYSKMTEEGIEKRLSSGDKSLYVGGITPYLWSDDRLSVKKVLAIDNDDLRNALWEMVPLIQKRFSSIRDLVLDIPESYAEILVCSSARKQLYLNSMEMVLEKLLIPLLGKSSSGLRDMKLV